MTIILIIMYIFVITWYYIRYTLIKQILILKLIIKIHISKIRLKLQNQFQIILLLHSLE